MRYNFTSIKMRKNKIIYNHLSANIWNEVRFSYTAGETVSWFKQPPWKIN